MIVSQVVALRKESVDRNRNYGKQHNVSIVALRKESVDRNVIGSPKKVSEMGRSPQGERG